MTILVTGAWQCTSDEMCKIENLCDRVVFMQNESEALPDGSENVDGIICNELFLYHDINIFPKLKYIQLTSAGFDRVPMEYIRKKNITLHNARGVYSVPMAEFALCGVLQLFKKSKEFSDNRNNKEWKKAREIKELFGKNVCIVGCGSVGTECAKRFQAFGCFVTGVDIAPHENDCYNEMVSLDELNSVLKNADVVVLTLPLTEETRNLFDEERFEKMKNGTVFINIARGAIVSEDALIKALEMGKLSGAVLDVFAKEPLETSSPLWSMDNVIVTPHNSFVGEGNGERLFDVIYENLRRESSI